MISLETAQKLKVVGIKPKYAVWLQNKNAIRPSAVFEHWEDAEKWKNERGFTFGLNNMFEEIREEYSLDQLLADIEGQGYIWHVSKLLYDKGYRCWLLEMIEKTSGEKTHDADSPTEAAAQALLWIYEQNGGRE